MYAHSSEVHEHSREIEAAYLDIDEVTAMKWIAYIRTYQSVESESETDEEHWLVGIYSPSYE